MRFQLLCELTCAQEQDTACIAGRRAQHACIDQEALQGTQGHPGRATHERGSAAAAGGQQAAVGAAVPLHPGCGGRGRRHVPAARPLVTRCSCNKSRRCCSGGAVHSLSRRLCVRQDMSYALLAGLYAATRSAACVIVLHCPYNWGNKISVLMPCCCVNQLVHIVQPIVALMKAVDVLRRISSQCRQTDRSRGPRAASICWRIPDKQRRRPCTPAAKAQPAAGHHHFSRICCDGGE